jgi:hypothetical protein
MQELWPAQLDDPDWRPAQYVGGPPLLEHVVLKDMGPERGAQAQATLDAVWERWGALAGKRENVKLCGSPRAVKAVEGVDHEMRGIVQALMGGAGTFVGRHATEEVLEAFRSDLGYPEDLAGQP